MIALFAARNLKFPLPALAVVAVCAVYLVFGSIGHDPWKTDDAVHLSVAWGMQSSGDWLLPRIAGDAWVGATPFYHAVAAATAWLTHWALPFHDGARLATALFGGIFLFFLYRAAMLLHGREAGLAAPVLAIGTLGLLVPIHDAQPAIATLAGGAVAYYGLARLPGVAGGIWLGIGCGAVFLFGGLNGGLPLLPLLLLPLLQGRLIAGATALAVAVGIALAWPVLLFELHPNYLISWWNDELATAAVHPGDFGRDHLELLAWFTWPLLPYGLWALWVERRQCRSRSWGLPFFGVLLSLAWFCVHEARPLQALPLLTPLALLAAMGSHKLRRGAANAFDWFGTMTFTLVIGLIWLGGIAMWTGWPEQVAHNFAKLQPGFEARFSFVALAVALLFTAGWMISLARMPRSPWRGTIHWTAGIVAMWGVLIALWFPWIDYGKSYRSVAESLMRALPPDHGCIERHDLGLAHRAVLDYHAGLHTQAGSPRANCKWMLSLSPAPAGWKKVWEGHRPGDRSERLRLYRREG
jgi:4-amino-4-deoxy-L-arabinose transferase-like glycosyltransferase